MSWDPSRLLRDPDDPEPPELDPDYLYDLARERERDEA